MHITWNIHNKISLNQNADKTETCPIGNNIIYYLSQQNNLWYTEKKYFVLQEKFKSTKICVSLQLHLSSSSYFLLILYSRICINLLIENLKKSWFLRKLSCLSY